MILVFLKGVDFVISRVMCNGACPRARRRGDMDDIVGFNTAATTTTSVTANTTTTSYYYYCNY